MLHIGNQYLPLCSGGNRRSFLQVGAAAMAGLTLPNWLNLQAAGAVDEKKAKIRNCITLFLVGSPGHLDTWDMKPDAPEDIRGKFKPISTSVPGVQICEHFPRMARIMDKVALIRSLHYSTGASHENGQRWMMTGHDFDAVEQTAAHGLSHLEGLRLERAICRPPSCSRRASATRARPRRTARKAPILGSAHQPFILGSDPARSDFKVADLEAPAGQELRVEARRKLLHEIDDCSGRWRRAARWSATPPMRAPSIS